MPCRVAAFTHGGVLHVWALLVSSLYQTEIDTLQAQAVDNFLRLRDPSSETASVLVDAQEADQISRQVFDLASRLISFSSCQVRVEKLLVC